MLFLSNLPYLKLLFYVVSTIIKTFIVTGHQFCASPPPPACDHRRPAAPRLVMHVITTFVELCNLFPHHSITHGIFTVYFTYLTMNISRFHISCIKTNG